MVFDASTMRLLRKIESNSMKHVTRSQVKYPDTLLASLEFRNKIVCLRTRNVLTNLLGCGAGWRRVMRG